MRTQSWSIGENGAESGSGGGQKADKILIRRCHAQCRNSGINLQKQRRPVLTSGPELGLPSKVKMADTPAVMEQVTPVTIQRFESVSSGIRSAKPSYESANLLTNLSLGATTVNSRSATQSSVGVDFVQGF
jgi:hypothetical protein